MHVLRWSRVASLASLLLAGCVAGGLASPALAQTAPPNAAAPTATPITARNGDTFRFTVQPDTVTRVDSVVVPVPVEVHVTDTLRLVRVDTLLAAANAPATPACAPSARDSAFVRWVANFAKWSDFQWKTYGADYGYANYYDGAHNYYAAAASCLFTPAQHAEYRRRADTIAVDYRVKYLEKNKYGSSPHWSLLRGMVDHYHATGDTMSAKAVVGVANKLWFAYAPAGNYWKPNGGTEARIVARVTQAQRLSRQLARERGDTAAMRVYGGRLDTAVTKILAMQDSAGRFPSASVCGGQLNYMVGLLMSELAAVDAERADPRILPMIGRALGYLDTQWDETAGAWGYASVSCTGVGGTGVAPDLNLQIAPGYWYWARRTGDEARRVRAERALAVGVVKAYLTGSKQFVENTVDVWDAIAWRR
jgi:endonuclease YncB( thermonuclease family)